MLVQLFPSPEQGFLCLVRRRELLEQGTYRMSPSVAVCLEKYSFYPFLGTLLGSETGPFITSGFMGMPGQGEIPLGLTEPILIVYCHKDLP